MKEKTSHNESRIKINENECGTPVRKGGDRIKYHLKNSDNNYLIIIINEISIKISN